MGHGLLVPTKQLNAAKDDKELLEIERMVLPSTGVTLFNMDTFCFTVLDLQLLELGNLPVL